MISVGLYEPEIPPNTGNVARTCAATGAPLHIVGPAKFRMDDAAVKRAGLDYWPHVKLTQHAGFESFIESLPAAARILCFTTKATRLYTAWEYRPDDVLLFGPETRGLPPEIREAYADTCLTIPIFTPAVRSLNLGNAVSIVLYEAIRQLGGVGGK